MIVESIDTEKLVTRLLPQYMRTAFWIAYVKALLDAADSANEDYLSYRANKLKEATYNGQTLVLEALLNEKVENSGNMIYIVNQTETIPETIIFAEAELQANTYIYTEAEAPLSPPAIYTEAEGRTLYNFIVYVPAGVNHDQVIAIVNKYKLVGKSYIIVTI